MFVYKTKFQNRKIEEISHDKIFERVQCIIVYTRSLVCCVFKYLGSECSAVKNRLTIERIDRETYLYRIKYVLLTYHLPG